MTVYAKSEKENLSKLECNNLKKIIDLIEKGLAKKKQ